MTLPDKPKLSDRDRHEEFLRQFTQHHRRIFAYIGALMPNLADAEEVMQETSLVLWRKWDLFDPSGDFFHWGCGIALREVHRYRRAHGKGRLQFNDSLLEKIAVEHLSQSSLSEARQQALTDCSERLTADDRELVGLRYGENANLQVIAEQMGKPANTLYKALQRIRKQLLQCIERRLSREDR